MKFRSIVLNNWKIFKGEQRLEFSVDPERPITLIFGFNGAGKTVLLNAFTWCLFSKFTDGFDQHHSHINSAVLENDPHAEASVRIEIEHDNEIYIIARTINKHGNEDVKVKKGDVPVTPADIHKIMPPQLSELFFFPAENFAQASVLAHEDSDGRDTFRIGKAVRSLLGVDIYHQATEDLDLATKSKSLKVSKAVGSESKLQLAEKEHDQALAQSTDLEARKKELPGLMAESQARFNVIEKDMARVNPEQIKQHQTNRQILLEQIRSHESACERAHSLYTKLARNSHRHFASRQIDSGIKQLKTARQKGLLPSRVDKQTLDEALTDNKCYMCGRELDDNSKKNIASLAELSSSQEMSVNAVKTLGNLEAHKTNSKKWLIAFRNELREFTTQLEGDLSFPEDADFSVLQSVLRHCYTTAESFHSQALANLERFNQDSGELQGIEENILTKYKIAVIENNKLTAEFDKIDKKLEMARSDLQQKLQALQDASKESSDATRKVAAKTILAGAKEFFQAAVKRIEQNSRVDFQRTVEEIYRELLIKPYTLEVGDNFSIAVWNDDRTIRQTLSQAEKVLLLLSFIGTIARLAPQYQQMVSEKKQFSDPGTIVTTSDVALPVVIDSPMSPLDEYYEENIAKGISTLLPQTIIPTNKKSLEKWKGVSDAVGSVAVIHCTIGLGELGASPQPPLLVNWGGQDHPYVTIDETKGASRAFSEIIQIVKPEHADG